MNEKTTELINTILEKAISVAEQTGEFVVEQAPDVIQQLLVWKFTVSLMAFCAGIISLIGLTYLINLVAKDNNAKNKDRASYHQFPTPMIWLMGVLIQVLVVVIAFGAWEGMMWIKIWLAPKLYLLEYGASLVK